MNFLVIFLTGLTIGGLTCMVVQGGLLASLIASREKSETKFKSKIIPVLFFLLAKLIVYTALGFFLGLFGKTIGISDNAISFLQIIAGIYMLAVALNLLNVHPIFRYTIIQPPRFITRKIRLISKSEELFAPIFLGIMTIFIPCGTTLAMEALAIASGNAFQGSMIMAVFVLGTFPFFVGLGYFTSLLGEKYKSRFYKLASVAIIYLGITTVNNSLITLGSSVTLQNLIALSPIQISFNDNESEVGGQLTGKIVDGKQKIDMTINASGYSPNKIVVQKDTPVNLHLSSKEVYNCSLAFRIPALKISKNLKPTDDQTITFTPTQKGKIAFSCAMGMYNGEIEVI